jgi:hypothetical protein
MLSVLLFALAAPATAPAQTPRPLARRCTPPGLTYAQKGPRVVAPQKLGEQPPAREYLAVVRQVAGCPEPAVVRSGIGGR